MASYCNMHDVANEYDDSMNELEDEYQQVFTRYYEEENDNHSDEDTSNDWSSSGTDDESEQERVQEVDASSKTESITDDVQIENHDNIKEQDAINVFYGTNAVACCTNECNTKIPKSLAIQNRQSFQKLSKSEQDVLVLSSVQSHRRVLALSRIYGKYTHRGQCKLKNKGGALTNSSMRFFFADIPICRAFFLFLHDMRKKRYENIVHHYENNCVTTRTHALKNRRLNKKALSAFDIECIITYIKTFAEKFAVPLAGRVANFHQCRAVLLPSIHSKASIHREYVNCLKGYPTIRAVGLRAFYYTWNKYCPYIIVDKPSSDLCDLCRLNVKKILASQSYYDKVTALNDARIHLQDAKEQREFYAAWRRIARESERVEISGVQRTFDVLSFDFAEQVHYPSSTNMPGVAYLKNGRKCSVFGIHDERTGTQRNYLIDEADIVDKGSNAVVSLIHHYLNNSAEVVILFADNYAAPSIGHAVMQYLAWRLISGLNARISLHLLFTSHTKFSPDMNFGLFKFAYSRANVDSMEDLVSCVETSSSKGFNTALPTIFNGRRNVVWSAWDEFLSNYFKPLPIVGKFQHFTFTSKGEIELKQMQNSDPLIIRLQTNTLKSEEAHIIEDIIPEPLSAARQWYLYEQIRDLCVNTDSKDEIAPKPNVPKEDAVGQLVIPEVFAIDISPKQPVSQEVQTMDDSTQNHRKRPHRLKYESEDETVTEKVHKHD